MMSEALPARADIATRPGNPGAIASEFLPALEAPRQQLVLLHGWGCNREIWRPLVATIRPWADLTLLDIPGAAGEPGVAAKPLEQLLEEILAQAPPKAVYLGWSLGAQLATELAHHHPHRVSALVTLCYNPAFTGESSWPGMPGDQFADFRERVEKNPLAALRRFDSLQAAGAHDPRSLLRQLPGCREIVDRDDLLAGLCWLQRDQRGLLAGLLPPQLHLLAPADALVPAAVREEMEGLLAPPLDAAVEMLAGRSHLAPLEIPGELASRLLQFLDRRGLLLSPSAAPVPLAKVDVAHSFSRAAPVYDSVAVLQRDVGECLLADLDEKAQPGVVLDLGCGTGHFRESLRARYPAAQHLGLDLAQGMIDHARVRFPGEGGWLVGDAEALPLAANSVDLVFSSLAIQWCYRPDLLFAELARVLRPGGRCIFTTLGPGTLRELRASWAAVDEHQHVNEFLPAGALEVAAQRQQGLRLRLRPQRFCMRYRSVRELLSELKTLGAHNVNSARPGGLTGRRRLQGMLQAYEKWREDDLLPATYDVLFGTLEKL